MQEKMNKEWMDEFEKNYSLYRKEWDFHYNQVKEFILSCLPMKTNHWGFIGVTNRVPEIGDKILNRVANISLLDINPEALKRARIHLASVYDFKTVEVLKFDNTIGFITSICEIFEKFEEGELPEKKLLDALTDFEPPEITYQGERYDLVTNLGIMDYYLMPLFTKYCPRFNKQYDSFFKIMQKLNDDAARISIQVLKQMLNKNGQLIISTPIERLPEGEVCKKSLFWINSIEDHIKSAGLVIGKKSTHQWEEYPVKGGHSHTILNVCCKKE